jgi:hypothetical protein
MGEGILRSKGHAGRLGRAAHAKAYEFAGLRREEAIQMTRPPRGGLFLFRLDLLLLLHGRLRLLRQGLRKHLAVVELSLCRLIPCTAIVFRHVVKLLSHAPARADQLSIAPTPRTAPLWLATLRDRASRGSLTLRNDPITPPFRMPRSAKPRGAPSGDFLYEPRTSQPGQKFFGKKKIFQAGNRHRTQ